MVEILKVNGGNILTIFMSVLIGIVLIKKGYREKVRQILFFLVCKAEETYGNGTGAIKYAAVTTWLYERMPSLIKFIFSQKEIGHMVEQAVVEMKKYLAETHGND
jgi:hypothetical protein